jgi:hypothetical protein
MADPPAKSAPGSDDATDGSVPPRAPRWVKIGGVVVVLLALILLAVMVIVGGEHGPRRHTTGGSSPEQPTAAAAPAELDRSVGVRT